MPDKPFFVYFAPGATHAPHHVAPGVDREVQGPVRPRLGRAARATFARQKELGVIPADAELTAPPRRDHRVGRHARRRSSPCSSARWRSTRASSSTPTTTSGRLIDALEDLEVLDDTIIYYIIGDNGASAEGTMNGAFNEMANFNGMAAIETPEFMLEQDGRVRLAQLLQPLLGRLGVGDELAVPVDQAGRLALGRHPQRHHRALARRHHREGRPAVAVHPRDRRGARRSSRPPACPQPTMVNGVLQAPIEGTSMLYAFNDADAPERHDLQYFEMFGNRGIYHQGWSAVTKHKTPWIMVGGDMPAFDDDVWELYDGADATSARPATSPPSSPTGWPTSSGCGSSRPRSTTCCPSTTAAASASTPTSPDDRR